MPILSRVYNIDVFYFPYLWASIIAPAKKIVVTLYDLAPGSSYPRWYQSINFFITRCSNYITARRAIGYAQKIIVVSGSIKAEYEKAYGHDKRLVLVNAGVSSTFKEKKTKKGNFFLAFADFSPRKNIDNVLKAFQMFVDSNKDIAGKYQLKVILSTHFLEFTVRNKCKVYGISNYVDIVVGISNKELCNFYNGASALIFPSLYEGFGFPVLEAMACTCPVITSNYGAMKEISGSAALHVNPMSVRSIANAILMICKNKKLRDRLSKAGLHRVRQFSWLDTANGVLKVYNDVYKMR
jgi:glycosyltransferase involved in cell wall biosynthesis